MSTKTYSATLVGLEPIQVEVEATALAGLPILVIIGLPNKAIEEARERITACFSVLNIPLKHRRTIVNLAPADIKKTRSSLELAILAALLQLYNVLRLPPKSMLFGELSLSGEIKPITGLLPLVLAAHAMGMEHVFVPAKNATHLPQLPNCSIHPLGHVSELLTSSLSGKWPSHAAATQAGEHEATRSTAAEHPLHQIVGQQAAKRALTVAIAGKHNILLIGPPGTGKTKLAQATPFLFPTLTKKQSLEVSSIYSLYQPLTHLIQSAPFRSPHHTSSLGGILGGGTHLSPGEITLAHRGTLFLDELAEFPRHILESLRQPLEEKTITLSRLHGSATYPCDFLLIAATNPCPCGYYGSQKRHCSCSLSQRQGYWQKLSGPLLDRFDLQVWLEAVSTEKLFSHTLSAEQEDPQRAISLAHTMQRERYGTDDRKNGDTRSDTIRTVLPTLHPSAQKVLFTATKRLALSSRASLKILSVSRTIADLDSAQLVTEQHVQEALSYRLNERGHNK